jgi:predicted amidohydrolase
MRDTVKVACVQAEPVVFDRDATLERLAVLTADAALNGRVETERVPELWDGRTAPRIMGVFEAWWESKSAPS